MIVVLANESPWPVRSGGRSRIDGLVRALRERDEVKVVVAVGRGSAPVGEGAQPLPLVRRSRAGALLGAGPRLGRGLLDPAAGEALRAHCEGADALLVSHSYLVPQLPRLDLPVLLDVPNLEVQRQAARGGWLGRVEAAKARRWESRAVASVAACACVDEADAAVVRGWGAARAVVVPNAAEVPVSPTSPADGPVLAVADWRYGPNAAALRVLVEQVAPQLGRPLVLAGRGSEGVPGGRGFVPDLGPLHDEAALVVSAVADGGGTQLKVVEALCRGRVVVTLPYGARSVPEAAREGCVLAEDPAALAREARRLLADPAERHRREAVLRAAPLPRSWAVAAAPLTDLLAGVAGA